MPLRDISIPTHKGKTSRGATLLAWEEGYFLGLRFVTVTLTL